MNELLPVEVMFKDIGVVYGMVFNSCGVSALRLYFNYIGGDITYDAYPELYDDVTNVYNHTADWMLWMNDNGTIFKS